MTFTIEEIQTTLREPDLFRSDIEGLLQETYFPTDMLLRAATFRRGLLMAGLTRFTNSEAVWRRPVSHDRVILVVGQAQEHDAAKDGLGSNLVLLKSVCQANADAYIVYKPHPEVWARMQSQEKSTRDLLLWCDECAGEVPLSELLPKVNEVHVMTSWAGFEALMRGKKVSCYGQTFYSGWGLTTDKVPMYSRSRTLSLDELVAAAMFCYPSYMSRLAGRVHRNEKTLQVLRPPHHAKALSLAA